jgi:hypothetical protein
MELQAKGLGVIPDSEVPAKVTRRGFTGVQESGKIGALLWREGLYSSHRSAWELTSVFL